MAYSLFKTPQDGSAQETWDKLVETLRQPAAIGAIASFGFHGLLWLFLPMLPAQPEQPDSPDSVTIVELSPAEQSKLPTTELPATFPPSILADPKLSAKLPSSLGTTESAELPSDGGTSMYSFPPASSPPYQLSDEPTSKIPQTFDISPSSQFSFPVGSSPIFDQSALIPAKPSTPKTPEKPTSNPDETETETAKTPDDTTTPKPAASTESAPPEERISLEEQLKRRREEIIAARQKFPYNPAGTAEDGKTLERQDQLVAFAQKVSGFSDKNKEVMSLGKTPENKIAVRDHYPEAACAAKLEGTAEFALVIEPDGKVAENQILQLQSSGYDVLNQHAVNYIKEQIASQGFKPGDKYRARYYEFKFVPTPSVCPPGAGKTDQPDA